MLLIVDQYDDGNAPPEVSRDDPPSFRLSMNQVGKGLASAFPDSLHDRVLISSFDHSSQTRNAGPPVCLSNRDMDAKAAQRVNEGVLAAVSFE